MDCREKLLSEFSNSLTIKGYKSEDVQRIQAALLLALRDYTVEPMPTALTVNENRNAALIRAFLATGLTEGKSRRTIGAYKYLLETFAGDVGKHLDEVATIDIRMWLAKKEQTASLATCENYRAYLSSFYSWMTGEEYIAKNPMLKIKPIKCEEKVKLPFSSVEQDALRQACGNLRDRAILEILLSSGVRVSELCALDREDIDLVSRSVIVKNGKGGKGRATFMSELAQSYVSKYLAERTDDSPALFLTRLSDRISTSGIEKLLRTLGASAGVKNAHPHRCRRTFATALARRGMPVQEIKQLMGHSDLNTTMIYCYMDDKTVEYSYKKCG